MASHPTILVAVDFEGASKRALEAAKWLASAIDADLVLVHAHDPPGFDHPEIPTDMVTRIAGLVEQAAKRSLAELATAHGATRTVFRHGDPAARILEAAAELAPAMVVMGTHGRHGLGRLFVGSIAAQVVRACAVPVVTVRAEPEDMAPPAPGS